MDIFNKKICVQCVVILYNRFVPLSQQKKQVMDTIKMNLTNIEKERIADVRKRLAEVIAKLVGKVMPDGKMGHEHRIFFTKLIEDILHELKANGSPISDVKMLPFMLRPINPYERLRMRRDSVKRLRAQGYTLMQISAELGIAENTVISDLKHIKKNG